MIIAEQKELTEIQSMIAPYRKILLVGCGTCVAFCSAGGPKEVDKLADALVSENKDLIIEKTTTPRQCAEKFIDRLEAFRVDVNLVKKRRIAYIHIDRSIPVDEYNPSSFHGIGARIHCILIVLPVSKPEDLRVLRLFRGRGGIFGGLLRLFVVARRF